MERMMKTSRPVWGGENEDVETAAVVWVEGAEYREVDGAEGPKNNPDTEKDRRG